MTDEDFGSSAPKQTRYMSRSSKYPKTIAVPHSNTRYMLRSHANANDADFEHIELPLSQRKRAVKTSLMVLNDDCLLKIFENLRTIDLRYVLQVNVRLNALVKYYVRFEYQIEVKPKICPDFTKDDFERMGYQKAKLYLQIFGHEIRSLNMDCDSDSLGISEVTLKMLPTLKNLEEFEFKILPSVRYELEDKLKHMLSLKKLKVLKFGLNQELMERSVSELLKGFSEEGIAIEHLELTEFRGDDDTYMRIAQLKSIKILKLFHLTGLQKEHVVHIARELQLLQELHIRMNSII